MASHIIMYLYFVILWKQQSRPDWPQTDDGWLWHGAGKQDSAYNETAWWSVHRHKNIQVGLIEKCRVTKKYIKEILDTEYNYSK